MKDLYLLLLYLRIVEENICEMDYSNLNVIQGAVRLE